MNTFDKISDFIIERLFPIDLWLKKKSKIIQIMKTVSIQKSQDSNNIITTTI